MNFADLAATLVAADPVGQAGRVLSRFVAALSAEGGALVAWTPGETPRVLAATNLPIDAIQTISPLLDRHRAGLAKGKPVTSRTRLAAPLHDGKALVGVVFIQGASSPRVEPLRPYLVTLAKAVVAASQPLLPSVDLDSILGEPERITKRTATLEVLQRSGWNIAEASRRLGVTRRTIYLRLAKWGVERKKFPKSAFTAQEQTT
jgi:hypothetical protein